MPVGRAIDTLVGDVPSVAPLQSLGMLDSSVSSPSVWCLLLVVLLWTGCDDDVVPNVAEGRYRAEVSGGMVDTLTGPARFRHQDGTLLGMELGQREGSGVSLEIGPEPLEAGAYDVVAAELIEGPDADSLKGMFAFLRLGNARFEATRGRLSVTHVDEGEVRGTFEFQMDGYATGSPDDLSIVVEGALRATPE